MPGDINECLEHARRCAELACTANSPEARAYFADLTKAWVALSEEMRAGQRFLDALKANALDANGLARLKRSDGGTDREWY